jgi:glycosyltransferase involved in cell wall biosynthesis
MLDFEDFKREYQKVPVEEYPNNVLEAVPEPMVSVHVSTYQHADFIRDCLDGVLRQETDFPFEIIIGEDESKDGTREICKEYADQYPDKIRLFLHRRENNIRIHGRPTGRFQATYSHFVARGKYLAICEGDDYWTDSQKLQKQVDYLEANEDCALTYHSHIEKCEMDKNRNKYRKKEDKKIKKFPHTLTLVYKNVVKKVPVEYLNISNGDVFLKSELKRHGKFEYLGNVSPAVYRKHGGGMYSSEERMVKCFKSFRSRAKLAKCFKGTVSEKKLVEEAGSWLYMFLSSEAKKSYAKKSKYMFKCMKLLIENRITIRCLYKCTLTSSKVNMGKALDMIGLEALKRKIKL